MKWRKSGRWGLSAAGRKEESSEREIRGRDGEESGGRRVSTWGRRFQKGRQYVYKDRKDLKEGTLTVNSLLHAGIDLYLCNTG